MKIMVCGKGGCGKSTITSLLAATLAAKGKKVLVVDMDESNFGLHRQLGLELPKDFTMYFGAKKGVFKAIEADADGKAFDKPWTFADLPEAYLSGEGNLKLMAIGKIHEAGEGCACPMGTLARQLIANMDLAEDEILLADTEAGVEHFGRGVDAEADMIFMVIDPSFESVKLSEKIHDMSDKIGKPVSFILNKTDAQQEAMMRECIKNPEAIVAAIASDKEVLMKGLKGEAITDLKVPGIEKICEKLGM